MLGIPVGLRFKAAYLWDRLGRPSGWGWLIPWLGVVRGVTGLSIGRLAGPGFVMLVPVLCQVRPGSRGCAASR